MRDRLVGREPLLARTADEAHLVFEGPPGSGKTALLRAATRVAERRGYQIAWAQAHPAERAFPFGVLRQLLDPLPARRPVLLAIDDVQWADPQSVDWLARVINADPAAHAHVRLVATRSPEIGTPGPTGPPAVAIPALSVDDVAALAGDLLGPAADEPFVVACHRAASGTALLVTELLRAAAEAGAGAGRGPAALPARVPARITRWVTARMCRASAAATRLAKAIVVLGERAEVPLVAELAGLDTGEAAAVAGALARAGFLTGPLGGGPLRFAHPVVRDAIDQLIGPGSRRVAHAAAAAVLHEARAPAEEVARHLLGTDPVGRRWAAERLRGAAAAAPRGSAAAVERLRRALREPVDGVLRAELLAELGHAELYAEAVPDRRRGLAAAIEHLAAAYETVRDAPLLARIAADLATAHYHDGAAGRARTVVDDAVARLSAGERGSAELAEVAGLSALGLALAGPGDGQAHADRLGRLRGAAAGDPDIAATVAAHLAGRAAAAGRRDEALAQARLAVEAGPPRTPLRQLDHHIAAGVLCDADRLDAAARCAADLIGQAGRAGPAGAATLGHALAARVAFREGRLGDAIEEARIASAVQFSINGRAHAGARIWELSALLVQGDQNAAAAILTDAGLLGGERPAALGAGPALDPRDDPEAGAAGAEAVLGAHLVGARGLLREQRGDLECALADHLECGRRLAGAGIANPAPLPWRSRAALVSYRLGRREAALRLAAEELGQARRWGTPRAIGVALHALGVAAAGPDGVSLLEESVALLARSPARVEHAGALYDLGRLRGETGRREDARRLLHESYRIATGCGARPLADLCATGIRRVGGRRPRVPLGGAAALTPRERRIAERAVAGATNREIAAELFLTLRTVEAHLTGVYRKLGISGRAELAARLAGADRSPGSSVPRSETSGSSGTH
jgi:DNA-binding CsgD family transcriptional regulator